MDRLTGRFLRIHGARALALLLVVLLTLTALPVLAPSAEAADAPAGFPAQPGIILRPADDHSSLGAIRAMVEQRLGDQQAVRSIEPIGLAGNVRIDLDSSVDAQAATRSLAGDPAVAYVEPVRRLSIPDLSAQLLPTDPGVGNQWGLRQIGAPRAWDLQSSSDVIVAVLDTGVSPTHPDLAGRLLPGWNVIANNDDSRDDAGHGTFVAGIIAANHNDGGVAGVAQGVRILPVKVLDQHGEGSTADFAEGIRYAVEHGARIINISAGGVLGTRELIDEVKAAEARGVLVVAAAGNEPGNHPVYPAAIDGVLGVGASTRDDQADSFSTAGPQVDLVAPGVDIMSDWFSPTSGDGYAVGRGTSASAPFVAGTAALMLAQRPDLSPTALRQLLTESALDIDRAGVDERTGFGRLDAYAALRLLAPVGPAGQGSIQADESGTTPALHFQATGFRPAETITAWATAGSIHRVFRGVVADGSGVATIDLGPEGRFPEGLLQVSAVGDQSSLAAQASFTVTAAPADAPFSPIQPFASSPDRIYFPETGHSLSGGFRAYWEAHSGLPVFGYPISEEFSERNPDTGQEYTVQYFERNRLEYHPENAGTPFEILIGRLGAQLATSQYPVASPEGEPEGTLYFPETGHSLNGAFRAYWEANGGLGQFGYPISEPIEEGGRLVQYFERNRLEYHPELPAPYQVLLSRLGVELARLNGYLR